MPVKKLKQFLDREDVKYVLVSHSAAYTAQEIAASAHISGYELAKTVVVKLDGKVALAVLPASFRVELKALQKAVSAKQANLASEQEFRGMFPECELGAMPPFGNLYELPVYADESLGQHKEIAFNAGSHTELIKLSYRDFERLVNPRVLRFAEGQAGDAASAP